MSARAGLQASRRLQRGFTLVELLVALAVMAVLSGLAWRGLDAMLRTRVATEQAAQRTQRLAATMSQWQSDLEALHFSGVVPALRFDGATLRLTREQPAGVQVVAWSLREGALWRSAQPPVTQARDLREQWRAAALPATAQSALKLLSEAESVQIYFHRDFAWTNAQSSGDRAEGAGDTAAEDAATNEKLPSGVRLLLALPQGRITRDIVLAPQEP